MTAVNYYATLLVRLDSVGDTGDTCSMDRFILLWRKLLIKHFVSFHFFHWEWTSLFWGLDFVLDEACFFRRRDFFFFWIGPGIYRMTFAVNQNWTCYFLAGICSENWTSCLNKRTRCFVDWIMWHPTEDLSAKKKTRLM